MLDLEHLQSIALHERGDVAPGVKKMRHALHCKVTYKGQLCLQQEDWGLACIGAQHIYAGWV